MSKEPHIGLALDMPACPVCGCGTRWEIAGELPGSGGPFYTHTCIREKRYMANARVVRDEGTAEVWVSHATLELLVPLYVAVAKAIEPQLKAPCRVCGKPTSSNESLYGVPLCLHTQTEREATEAT